MGWGRLRAVRWAAASIVFQGAMHSLNPVRRVGAQILEPILLHEEGGGADPDRRVARLLEDVGLGASAPEAYPHQLSGGQRHGVAMAMAAGSVALPTSSACPRAAPAARAARGVSRAASWSTRPCGAPGPAAGPPASTCDRWSTGQHERRAGPQRPWPPCHLPRTAGPPAG